MRLENWSFVAAGISPYQAPETAEQQAQGEVYGHPERPDGQHIVTSVILSKEPGVIKTYSGSTYELGAAHPEYLKAFPTAKDYEGK